MNDEKVFRLLMETNPVPDPDGLDSPLALTELERRSPIMATRQSNSGKRSNGLLVGAIAAVAVLIVGLGSWAAIAGPDTTTTAAAAASSTTSPSTTGTTTTPAPPTEAEALAEATVLEYYDAVNRHDIPARIETFTSTYAAGFGSGRFERILAAANERVTVLEPCQVVNLNSRGFPVDPDKETALVCTVSYYNDFTGPANVGIEPLAERFTVTKDGKIFAIGEDLAEDPQDPADFFAYNRAYYDWLEVAYPDVFEEIKVADGESIPGWFAQDPRHMTIAVQYVEEFVAQSDVYPIEPDDD